MAFKSSELPSSYPDSDKPVFGINDMNEIKVCERRKRAQNLYLNQLNMASEKRKFETLRNSKQRREEEEMLRKTKTE